MKYVIPHFSTSTKVKNCKIKKVFCKYVLFKWKYNQLSVTWMIYVINGQV